MSLRKLKRIKYFVPVVNKHKVVTCLTVKKARRLAAGSHAYAIVMKSWKHGKCVTRHHELEAFV
jgi:hypothetical protein